MERRHSIPLLEFCHAFADFVNNAGDVVALIYGFLIWHPFWSFPVSMLLVQYCIGRLGTWNFPNMSRLELAYASTIVLLHATHQSLGLLPEKMTLVTTWLGPAFGIGTSLIVTLGPLATTASFIVEVEALRI